MNSQDLITVIIIPKMPSPFPKKPPTGQDQPK